MSMLNKLRTGFRSRTPSSPVSPQSPTTPKIPNKQLPNDGGEDDCCCCSPSPSTSRAATPIKAQMPRTSANQRPIRSILKPQTAVVSEVNARLQPKAPTAAPTRAYLPSPVSVYLEPMKPPAVDLHWQLLPYQVGRSKQRLYFDIAMPADEVRFVSTNPARCLSIAELNKPATDIMITKMSIQFDPFTDWEVYITRAQGIRCRDVFEAIYESFNTVLKRSEMKLLPKEGTPERKRCDAAFKLRCKLAPGLYEVERGLGYKRVDVLMKSTVFKGLTQPKSGGDWVLNLGI